jgi:hypothetical protein
MYIFTIVKFVPDKFQDLQTRLPSVVFTLSIPNILYPVATLTVNEYNVSTPGGAVISPKL